MPTGLGCAPAMLFCLLRTLQCPETWVGGGCLQGPTSSRTLKSMPVSGHHPRRLSSQDGPRGSASPCRTNILPTSPAHHRA